MRGEALKPGIALAEDCKGPLRSARPHPSPRLDLSRQGLVPRWEEGTDR